MIFLNKGYIKYGNILFSLSKLRLSIASHLRRTCPAPVSFRAPAGFLITILAFLCCLSQSELAHARASSSLTLFVEPKYKPWSTHFDYANPKAPKGGRVRLSYPASFDSLNAYILKGLPAPGLNMLYDPLMAASLDEPQSYYGVIAQYVDLAEDHKSITFHLNPKARWHDGSPITPEDVIFSLETLKSKGDPLYKLTYAGITSAEKIAPGKVKLYLEDPENRDLPFLAASMPIVSKAYYSEHDFEKSSLKPPLGSGPYKILKVDAGRSITYERVKDYWAENLLPRKGQNNFDRIRYDVYRDDTVALEALKAHEFDLYEEYIARNWATAYNVKAVEDGRLIKYTAKHKIPRGMQAFLFNLRKSKFKDPRVREAISLTLDFEWLNRTIFFDAYDRNISFFQNTDFAARNLPSEGEKKLMEPFRKELPEEVWSKIYAPSVTDGSGVPREELLNAQKLLNEAGWKLVEGKRINPETGEPLTIEFLSTQKTFERVISAMIRNLKRLGITARFRLVDDAQYQKRLEHKDYDIISIWINRGLIFPGNEQKLYWHSSQADIPGSQNLAGLKNPAIDAFLNQIANAKDITSLTDASRALDRALLWQHLIIPHWSISNFRVAFWNMFERPKITPTYGLGFETWWLKEDYRQ